MQKYLDEEETTNNGSQKYFSSSLLRNNNEFFNDEDYVKHNLIRVKYVKLRNGNEDWEILENNKVVLVLKGIRFTNKEKDFFKTIDGVNFIIGGYKEGWNSILRFKKELSKRK